MRLPGVLRRSSRLQSSLAQQALLLTAALTYLWVPDDVVWSVIKSRPDRRLLEHLCFGLAAALIGLSAALPLLASRIAGQRKGWSAHDISSHSRLLNALGVASLFPLPGSVLLLMGEAALAIRTRSTPVVDGEALRLGSRLLQAQTVRFCAFCSMCLFAITLNDRVAEILFGATALLSLLHSIRLGAQRRRG